MQPSLEANARKDPGPDRELQLSEERTHLAAARTRDALERTLMSWIRTALSMICYGFGLFKVLQYMLSAKDGSVAQHPAADILATVLVGLGTALLIGATIQYYAAIQALRKDHPVAPRLPFPMLGAAGVALVGLFALLNLLHIIAG